MFPRGARSSTDFDQRYTNGDLTLRYTNQQLTHQTPTAGVMWVLVSIGAAGVPITVGTELPLRLRRNLHTSHDNAKSDKYPHADVRPDLRVRRRNHDSEAAAHQRCRSTPKAVDGRRHSHQSRQKEHVV